MIHIELESEVEEVNSHEKYMQDTQYNDCLVQAETLVQHIVVIYDNDCQGYRVEENLLPICDIDHAFS